MATKHHFLGHVIFDRWGRGDVGIAQHWNPDKMSREQRERIADELEKIAKHMRFGEFENEGTYKRFPYNARSG